MHKYHHTTTTSDIFSLDGCGKLITGSVSVQSSKKNLYRRCGPCNMQRYVGVSPSPKIRQIAFRQLSSGRVTCASYSHKLTRRPIIKHLQKNPLHHLFHSPPVCLWTPVTISRSTFSYLSWDLPSLPSLDRIWNERRGQSLLRQTVHSITIRFAN